MAALSRPDTANYEIHEHVKVDTTGTRKKDPRRSPSAMVFVCSFRGGNEMGSSAGELSVEIQ